MSNDKKTVLITGAGGATAKRVISQLQTNYNIVGVDFRREIKLGKNIPCYLIDTYKRNFEDIFRAHKIDGVIHLGRVGSIRASNFRSRYNTNVIGTKKLLDLCIKYKVQQVLILSTYFVYGADAFNPSLLDEQTPLKASGLTLDLVDSVELENLATLYYHKHPEINLTILRPCNIVGPGVNNTISRLLSSKRAPVLTGFSPMMQFIHIEDMAEAIKLAYANNIAGIYNIAPNDYISYQHALKASGCKRIFVPSVPPALARTVVKSMRLKRFPSYLINYFKYPVIIDGSLFKKTFKFTPKRGLDEIFTYYKKQKEFVK